jgi:hypothetical protein
VELGRIDIIIDVSILSTYLCLPCEFHIDAVLHVFAYLAHHQHMRVVIDPTYLVVDMCAFVKTDWKSMYRELKKSFLMMLLFSMGTMLTFAFLLILIILGSISQGIQGIDL